MKSLILQTWTRFLTPVMLLFSLLLLWRGHHEPGGGFVGGLMAAAAVCLNAMAFDVRHARRALWFHPRHFIAAGLITAVASAVTGPINNQPFMTGQWYMRYVTALGQVKLGTPLLFDLGVYLLVLGATSLMVLTLMGVRDRGA